jgi:hypothetical protein
MWNAQMIASAFLIPSRASPTSDITKGALFRSVRHVDLSEVAQTDATELGNH